MSRSTRRGWISKSNDIRKITSLPEDPSLVYEAWYLVLVPRVCWCCWVILSKINDLFQRVSRCASFSLSHKQGSLLLGHSEQNPRFVSASFSLCELLALINMNKVLKYIHQVCCNPWNLCTIQYRSKIGTMTFTGYCLCHHSLLSFRCLNDTMIKRLAEVIADLVAHSNFVGRSIANGECSLNVPEPTHFWPWKSCSRGGYHRIVVIVATWLF